ncbi:RICIN domain-containing protein [Streptomyces sp. Tue6028]|uniref:RICIN domain-containing protein n=1 Tax=Streptomyces sp. Tue6028 TaxID=2036037 RepID=UPI000BB3E113|nr:RICIN domain-containing protein [Streptomyces sp. Tue6028]
MRTPHPPRPPYPPGGVPGESDESLAARLRGAAQDDAAHPVALLMARHWQSAHDYAVICLASSAPAASMVTATSFHRALDRLGEGDSAIALRPELLVDVRDTVREWSADDRITGVLPDLGKPAGGRGMRAAKSMTAENRKLAERAFHTLPGLSRCLLWHTEVEAEPISVPAGLSGMDTDIASAALEQAREQFREGCVRAHRELAPSKECGFYNRLLDVPIRRGGALLPDVRQHLAECSYCRHAAEQLGHFERGLGSLIAEAVLGWGAQRYLDSRPGRAGQRLRPRGGTPFGGRLPGSGGRPGGGARRGDGHGADGRPGTGGRQGGGGRHRLLGQFPTPGRGAARQGEVPPKAVLTGAGLSAVLLATVLAAGLWPHDEGGADPAASTGAGSSHSLSEAPGSRTPSAASSPPTSAGLPTGAEQTRLRNLAADLCLDIRGGNAKPGAETELAVCSSAWTQQWSYEYDGLLRSIADPGLCLDSHADNGVVLLQRCVAENAARGKDMRYDLTVQGELLPRRRDGLAVAPASDDPDTDVVVKVRDGSDEQRWRTDSPSDRPKSLSVAGTSGPSAPPASDEPTVEDTPAQPGEGHGEPSAEVPADPGPTAAQPYQEPRAVAVGDGHDDADPQSVLPLGLSGLVDDAGLQDREAAAATAP